MKKNEEKMETKKQPLLKIQWCRCYFEIPVDSAEELGFAKDVLEYLIKLAEKLGKKEKKKKMRIGMNETEKILADKELTKEILEARKKGSESAPYKPL